MPRPTPYAAVQERLRPRLGPDVETLPQKWERLGDVVVLRLPDTLGADDDRAAIGAAYADVLGARVVLHDRGGIQGRLRQPDVVRLHGEGSAETALRQDHILYHLDPEAVMFSSGNIEERIRMGRIHARGETLVDLCAGIGYFTLPLVVHAGAARAYACELNPVSARYLRKNAAANGVAERIDVLEGDCRTVAPLDVADRVILGWFPGGHALLPTALAALRPEGGTLHYHDMARADAPGPELLGHLDPLLDQSGFRLDRATTRVVKSYAPGVVHAVLDAGLVAEDA